MKTGDAGTSNDKHLSYNSSVGEFDDDAIFKRRLRPGMSEIDVPGFFKR